MADSGALRAGRAFVELSADDSRLAKGLKAAQAKLEAWGASISAAGVKLAALGGALTAPLAGAATLFVSTGAELGAMAQRTGIAAEELSALSYAAKRSGLDAEELEGGIKRLQKAVYNAGTGNLEARQAFTQLGMSLSRLKGATPDKQLEMLADAFGRVNDPTKRAGLALKLFEESGTKLLPFLSRGTSGIEALKEEGRRLGVVLGGEDVATAREFKGVMIQLTAAAQGVALAIGRAVIPGMTRLRNLIMPAVEQFTAFARANAGLFDVLFDIGTGITAAGVGLVVFGKGVALVGAGLGGLKLIGASLVSVVVVGFKIWAAAFYAVLSPIGLCVAAVSGVVAAFLYLTEIGGQIRGVFTDAFTGVAAAVKSAWAGIADAMAAGNLLLAGKVAWAGLKVVWLEGVAALKEVWAGLIQSLSAMWDKFVIDFQRSWLLVKYRVGLISKEQGDIEYTKTLFEEDERKAERDKTKQEWLAGIRDEVVKAQVELDKLKKQAGTERMLKEAAKIEHLGPEVASRVGGVGQTASAFNASAALLLAGTSPVVDRLEAIRAENERIRKGIQALLEAGAVFS